MRPLILFLVVTASLLGCLQTTARRAANDERAATGLQALARQREFHIGAAIAMQPFREERQYQETLKREFNACVAENAFKFDSVHPAKDRYNFAETDALVAFAEANNLKLRGHTLIWHKQLPAWVMQGNYNRAAAVALLEDHITTLVKRYQGKVWAWDVVNEAIAENEGGLRKDSFWYEQIGPDYIKLAFQFAHKADPHARLYYNDFSAADLGRKSKDVYNLVRELKKQGVQLHGVGWQMHVNGDFKIKSAHRDNARRLAELGLELSITELDVRMPLPLNSAAATLLQASVYLDVASFCLQQPNCQALMLWGFTDKYSWIPQVFPNTGDALIFDAAYRPKPAYTALQQSLQAAITSAPKVSNATLTGEQLAVTGVNFSKGAVLFINWQRQRTESDKQAPASALRVNKIATIINPGQPVKLQVQNPDGRLSPPYNFTRQ